MRETNVFSLSSNLDCTALEENKRVRETEGSVSTPHLQ